MPKASDFIPSPSARARYSSARFQTEEPTIVPPRYHSTGVEREMQHTTLVVSNVPLRSGAAVQRHPHHQQRGRRDVLFSPLNRILKFIVHCVALMLIASFMLLAIHFRPTPCARNLCLRNNLASSSLGATIIPTLTSPAPKPSVAEEADGPHTPESGAALTPEFAAHACWSFHGSEAQLGILLAKPAFLTNVSIGHVPGVPIASAPRDLTVWGVVDGLENHQRFAQHSATLKKIRAKLPPKASQPHARYPSVPLTSLHFDIRYGKPIQTFAIYPEVVDMGMDFGVIEVQVHSNWGWNHTDVCHVGIYGDWIQM
ncbi:hypothetical protein K474DRAFT_1708734 [Panus rudis PR-1116 ss-1]|nr:hypothetical protein K474DRAFT_1708734 [Panus rudis PR-1116 ss-1]